jgi:hypothetical protein
MNFKKHRAMKTRILTLVLVSLLVGFSVQAEKEGVDSTTATKKAGMETTFQAAINEYHNNVVEFRVEKPAEDAVWMKILDEKGLIMYAKRVKKGSLVELDCEISKLPTGTYDYVVIRNGKEELRKSIAKK